MRMAHLLGAKGDGGAEGFFERLTIALHQAGEVVLPVVRPHAERVAKLQAAGLDPVELPFGGYLDFRTGPRLGALLRDWRPEVVVAWQNRANRFAAMAKRGAGWTLVGRMGGYYDLKYYRACDHVVGNTPDLHRHILAHGVAPERAHYLPNFAADLLGMAPAALPAPPGAPKLLAFGRLHANKGFDTLLRALALLPGAHLSLAGEGPEQAALAALARQLGIADRVAFLGWRSDIGALLAGCDIFICPSRHEPLGNVVLEAWSAARPVVATDSQGPADLIRDGETGLLVAKDAPQPLAAAIAGLLADPARAAALAEAGRAEFLRDHAEATVLRRWRDFLHAVAAKGATPCAA